jgi:hypothetical protein
LLNPICAWEIRSENDPIFQNEKKTADWIDQQIGPYYEKILVSAQRNNIPPRLLATVILTELGDYSYFDQKQETFFSTGSVGMAQLAVTTVKEHGLLGNEDDETSINPAMEYMGGPDDYRNYEIWSRLNQPDYAIEYAAREIDWLLKEINKNMDKPWQKALLNGPIDRQDPYENVKPAPGYLNTQVGKAITLSLLVTAAYNSPDIIRATWKGFVFPNDPWLTKIEEGGHYINAITHAQNSRIFAECLEKDIGGPLFRLILIQENFNIGSYSNWEIDWSHSGNPEGDPAQKDFQPPEVKCEKGTNNCYLRGHTTQDSGHSKNAPVLYTRNPTNVGSWQFDSRLQPTEDDSANFIVLSTGDKSWNADYYMVLHSRDEISLQKRKNGKFETLISGTGLGGQDDQWHQIKVTRDTNGLWSLFKDRALLGKREDSTFTDLPYLMIGRYGDFDNIIVTGPSLGFEHQFYG